MGHQKDGWRIWPPFQKYKEKFIKHTRIIRAAVQMSNQELPADDASMNKLLFKTKRGKLYNDEMMTQ